MSSLLAARAKVGVGEVASMRAYLFRSAAFVVSPTHDRALPLVRGMVARPADVNPEMLLQAVRSGAEVTSPRILSPQGRYVYQYQARTDHDETYYGWLRHAGTTYALFEAFGELGDPTFLAKGELALQYLDAHLVNDAEGQGKYVLDTNDEEQQKVGGAGLSLLAYTEHAIVTGDRSNIETMRALARLIMSRQYDDGRFKANVDLPSLEGTATQKKEPVYYVGEAALGLMRLYAIDPQPAYLDSARRAADWVVRVRDSIVSEDNQEHDHWISYAFNDLFRVTRQPTYLEHAYKIARAITQKLHAEGSAPAPDWAGSFYEGQSTPAATRLEAYDADISVSRFAGKPDGWLLAPAREVARSTLSHQYRPDNELLAPQPRQGGGRRAREPLRGRRADRLCTALHERLAPPGAHPSRSGLRGDRRPHAGPCQMTTLDVGRFPRAAAYLSSLPDGLASHPTCQVRDMVLDAYVGQFSALGAEPGLPAQVADMLAGRSKGQWQSGVCFQVVHLVARDRGFVDDQPFF